MDIWAIIPVKPFNRAKSRLAKALTPEQRQTLAEKMFRHSIEVLTSVPKIAGVMVISRDTKALGIARDYQVQTVQEAGTPELNAALLRGSQAAMSQGADGVLVLPADLPLVNVTDIEQILHLGRFNASVVLVPDRNTDGTNALLVNPPGFIPFSFGEGSFRRHTQLAEEANARIKVYRSETMGLDIDTPDDLALYKEITGEQLTPTHSESSFSVTE
ncbi:MAG: 2-phospho-L-lactate guanylyltransferase [Chloroflexota bacterium]